jgi:hypothetical protein
MATSERLRAELASVLERSIDLVWLAKQGDAAVRPRISGASDGGTETREAVVRERARTAIRNGTVPVPGDFEPDDGPSEGGCAAVPEHPHGELYYAELTESRTGETRIYRNECFVLDEDVVFLWAEGNYSCDCNRARFFAEAGGEADPFEDEPATEFAYCSDGLFRVTLVREDGTVLYDEGLRPRRTTSSPGDDAG